MKMIRILVWVAAVFTAGVLGIEKWFAPNAGCVKSLDDLAVLGYQRQSEESIHLKVYYFPDSDEYCYKQQSD